MKNFLIFTLAIVAIVTACNRAPTPKPNKQDMLRSGKWSISSGRVIIKLPNGKDTTLNYLDYLPFCRRDDYMVFHEGQTAAIFTASNKCSPADPDSTYFNWYFSNNETNLSMYHGFDFIYGIREYIMPFRFDTTWDFSHTTFVLDTIHGILDTEFGYTRVIPILDTIFEVRFDSVNLKYNNLYNAKVLDFTESSFTLSFFVYATYPDSTQHHTGMFIYTDPISSALDTLNWDPILRPDTLKYTIKYIKN
ncbi:MAG: hypothetical protein K0Q79_1147 [Flavipsychrobacter sp.]|jgi:hypothetical protein|nr:hypothetical protein [Flavipsychrobacter sp.]